MLSDELVAEINTVILNFGHGRVLKKNTALRLKSYRFVVESNVHFPTDYYLLWDSTRKCSLDIVSKFLKKYKGIQGWRKISKWRREIKGLMHFASKLARICNPCHYHCLDSKMYLSLFKQ